VFGVSFGEVMLIAVVALVVFDPRRLPEVLGTLGKWIAKLRRVTTEMRRQTGIDEILRQEGLSGGLNELRSMLRPDLTGVGHFGSGLGASTVPSAIVSSGQNSGINAHGEAVDFDRYREYPTEGADAHGAIPEDLLDPPPALAPEPPQVAPPAKGSGTSSEVP
jgi:sec-independent protein translocase protein TatB